MKWVFEEIQYDRPNKWQLIQNPPNNLIKAWNLVYIHVLGDPMAPEKLVPKIANIKWPFEEIKNGHP